jgi:hypothetical protein
MAADRCLRWVQASFFQLLKLSTHQALDGLVISF